jgi:hypothetical protein
LFRGKRVPPRPLRACSVEHRWSAYKQISLICFFFRKRENKAGDNSAWIHITVYLDGHKEILICSESCWAKEPAAGLNQAGRKQRWFFLLFLLDNRRIREAQKHVDPVNPDPDSDPEPLHWTEEIVTGTAYNSPAGRLIDDENAVVKMVNKCKVEGQSV